jgi:ABC-type amino acid transport substrate-binding protein
MTQISASAAPAQLYPHNEDGCTGVDQAPTARRQANEIGARPALLHGGLSARRFSAPDLLLLLTFVGLLLSSILGADTPRSRAASFSPISAIQRIRERKNVLVAGVPYDFAPLAFVNQRGEVAGFSVDLLQEIASSWGVQVQFVPVTAADQRQKLSAGAVDLLLAAPHRWESEAALDFSRTYLLDGQSLLLNSQLSIQRMSDLHAKSVAVVRGTPAADQLDAYNRTNGNAVLILPFQEHPSALSALLAGQVDAFFGSGLFAHHATQENKGLRLIPLDVAPQAYAMGLASGDAAFRALVDYALQSLQTTGQYRQLYARWLPTVTPPAFEPVPGQAPFTLANAPTDRTAPSQSRLALIQKRGRLQVGVPYDFPPFGFMDAQGNLYGLDVDLARALAERWLGDATAVDFTPVTASTRLPLLTNGVVDLLIGAMTHTYERDEQIDFSQSYFLGGQGLLVGVDSTINKMADLDGLRVAVVNGSTSLTNIAVETRRLGIQIELLPFQEYYMALQALKAGQVDVFTANHVVLTQFAEENPEVRMVDIQFSQQPYAIGLPNGDHELRDLVNFTLQTMQRDGAYAAIHRAWLGDAPPFLLELWPGQFAGPRLPLLNPTSSAATATIHASPTQTPSAPQRMILIPSPTPQSAQSTGSTTANIYRVQSGDTLSIIADKVYGDPLRWFVLYEANKTDIGANPSALAVGMELFVPPRP